MADLDLRKLRYFVAVAEELNYGRAAARLHIAQPVLSRQIAALEVELGVVLFERSTSGTRLTDAGRVLLGEAELLLSNSTAFLRRARQVGRGADRFTIAFMPGIIVTPLSRQLQQRFPGLTVDVIRTEWDTQAEVVHDGRADVSILRSPVDTRGLSVLPLFTEPRLVVMPAGHPLADRASVTVEELAHFDLLQDPDAVPEWRDAVRRVRPRALGRDRERLPVVHAVESKLEHVASGRGLVVLPASTARYYTRGDIVARPVTGLPPGDVLIGYSAGRTSPYVEAAVRLARRLGAPDVSPPSAAVPAAAQEA
jgi:DNA-binding transcriptional LysR family regulator